jgi:hypothetical protein
MTSHKTAPEALRRFLVTDRPDENVEILDITQAAAQLQESPESVERSVEQNLLLAWRDDRGWRIPAEQIMGPHRIVPGMDRVLGAMSSPRAAWEFLRLESPFFPGEPQRPLDVLKMGQIEDVLRAICSHGEAFT